MRIIWIIFAALAAFVTGIAGAQSGSVYGDRAAQQPGTVLEGIVLQARQVRVAGDGAAAYGGATAGAAIGTAIGAAIGRNDRSAQMALGVVGGVLGGLVGRNAGESWGGVAATEYLVRVIRAGQPAEVLAVAQPHPEDRAVAGERVYLVQTAGAWRVIRAEMPQSAAAPLPTRAVLFMPHPRHEGLGTGGDGQ